MTRMMKMMRTSRTRRCQKIDFRAKNDDRVRDGGCEPCLYQVLNRIQGACWTVYQRLGIYSPTLVMRDNVRHFTPNKWSTDNHYVCGPILPSKYDAFDRHRS
jgi:hypothetical protein